jgi:hypothetical protein
MRETIGEIPIYCNLQTLRNVLIRRRLLYLCALTHIWSCEM